MEHRPTLREGHELKWPDKIRISTVVKRVITFLIDRLFGRLNHVGCCELGERALPLASFSLRSKSYQRISPSR
jgi:hypothetical protein